MSTLSPSMRLALAANRNNYIGGGGGALLASAPSIPDWPLRLNLVMQGRRVIPRRKTYRHRDRRGGWGGDWGPGG